MGLTWATGRRSLSAYPWSAAIAIARGGLYCARPADGTGGTHNSYSVKRLAVGRVAGQYASSVAATAECGAYQDLSPAATLHSIRSGWRPFPTPF